MTKAQEMRKLANKANERKTAKTLAKYDKYVKGIIGRKIRFASALGFTVCKVRIKKKYAPTMVKDFFEKYGFNITDELRNKNGKVIFQIKW